MSPIKNKAGLLLLAAVALVSIITAGCGDANKKSVFDADSGKHPADWYTQHRTTYSADPNVCRECHGADLHGGASGVSCYSANFNGQSCHAAGPVGHPTNWVAVGHRWKVVQEGTASCATAACHGTDLGGVSGPSCGTCHAITPTASCNNCHSFPPTSGKHNKHIAKQYVDCSVCHTGNHAFVSTTLHSGPVLLNFQTSYVAKSGTTASYNATGHTCSKVSCHGGNTTPNWTSGAIDVNTQCTSCHAYGTTEYNSFNSGMHYKHVVDPAGPQWACTVCHDTAKLSVNHFTSLLTTVMEGPAAQTLKSTLNYNGTSCSPSCHGTETW